MDEEKLNKIQEALERYYKTDEIDIDLANQIHDYCCSLLAAYKRLLKARDIQEKYGYTRDK